MKHTEFREMNKKNRPDLVCPSPESVPIVFVWQQETGNMKRMRKRPEDQLFLFISPFFMYMNYYAGPWD